MSHPSHVEHLRAAREAGYEVRLFYVATEDPANNIVLERRGRGMTCPRAGSSSATKQASPAGLTPWWSQARPGLSTTASADRPLRLVATSGPEGVRLLCHPPPA